MSKFLFVGLILVGGLVAAEAHCRTTECKNSLTKERKCESDEFRGGDEKGTCAGDHRQYQCCKMTIEDTSKMENMDHNCYWTRCKSKLTKENKCPGGRVEKMREEDCENNDLAQYYCCR